MIHYYDRLFGEYCNFIKYQILTRIAKNIHNTLTFETMKDKANDNGINVIRDIQSDKNAEILDNDGIELLLKKAKDAGLMLEADESLSNFNGIAFNDNGNGGSITVF